MDKYDVIKKGGDILREKNIETAKAIDGMVLTEKARDLISNTDFNLMYELFGEMTEEDINQMAETYSE